MILRLFGFAGLIGCLGVVFFFESSSSATGVLRLLHWPAMTLTGVGPFFLVMLCCDGRSMYNALALILGRTAKSRRRQYDREAMLLQQVSRNFFTEGPTVFEKVRLGRRPSIFIAKMVERLTLRLPMADVRDLLETERDRRQVKIVQALIVLNQGVKLTPSIGMLGTILGMVQLLSTLEDPSHLGSHMSLALLTTFFGLFFSLVIWTPMQQKVERILDAEMDGYNMAVRWLELLELRKPATYFADSVELPQRKPAKNSESAA